MLTARERGRQRMWNPAPERVEVLATLSELFACADVGVERALRESAATLAALLGDAVVICRLSADLRWVEPLVCDVPAGCRKGTGLVGHRFRADRGFTAGVVETRGPVLVPRVTPLEIELLQSDVAPAATALGVHGFVLAPMSVRGRLTGVLAQCRLRADAALECDDCRFLQEVALRVALGMAAYATCDA